MNVIDRDQLLFQIVVALIRTKLSPPRVMYSTDAVAVTAPSVWFLENMQDVDSNSIALLQLVQQHV